MAPYVLGIDGGGAHTLACLLDADSGAMALGDAGPSNVHSVSLSAATRAIEDAARQAVREAETAFRLAAAPRPAAMVCCLSGAGRDSEQRAVRGDLEARDLADRVAIGHDAEATLASGMVFGPGIAAIAGTGSFVWGRGADGETARADGWGSLLGDESGAFGIGLEALRAACRRHDGRGPETPLLALALEHYALDDPSELIAALAAPEIPRDAISAFAPRVFEAAGRLDPVAIAIVENAAAGLVRSALAVRRRLFADDEACAVVLGGRIARDQVYYRERFATAYRAACVFDTVLCPADSLALGAARLALRELGIEPKGALPEALASGTAASDEDERIFQECASLQTEQRNPAALDLDQADALEIVRRMNTEDQGVAPAVEKVLPQIAEAVSRITAALRHGGRLFYAGAGTSGRLGCLDAAECPPTFGTPPELVQGLIAGGAATLLRSREGAEDQAHEAARDLEDRRFGARDVLVGIAASRRTPYVLAALEHARRKGGQTALITCSPLVEPMENVDVLIAPVVGPEVVMGSTRLKAATAQKMVLNMLTTASMILSGKVYKGMMVDLQMSCKKLSQRAIRTIMTLTQLDYEGAVAALSKAGGSVKRALVMAEGACSAARADGALEQADGMVRAAIEKAKGHG